MEWEHYISKMQMRECKLLCVVLSLYTHQNNQICSYVMLPIWSSVMQAFVSWSRTKRNCATNNIKCGFVVFDVAALAQSSEYMTVSACFLSRISISVWPVTMSAVKKVCSLPSAAAHSWASTSTSPAWFWQKKPRTRSLRAVRLFREGSPQFCCPLPFSCKIINFT